MNTHPLITRLDLMEKRCLRASLFGWCVFLMFAWMLIFGGWSLADRMLFPTKEPWIRWTISTLAAIGMATIAAVPIVGIVYRRSRRKTACAVDRMTDSGAISSVNSGLVESAVDFLERPNLGESPALRDAAVEWAWRTLKPLSTELLVNHRRYKIARWTAVTTAFVFAMMFFCSPMYLYDMMVRIFIPTSNGVRVEATITAVPSVDVLPPVADEETRMEPMAEVVQNAQRSLLQRAISLVNDLKSLSDATDDVERVSVANLLPDAFVVARLDEFHALLWGADGDTNWYRMWWDEWTDVQLSTQKYFFEARRLEEQIGLWRELASTANTFSDEMVVVWEEYCAVRRKIGDLYRRSANRLRWIARYDGMCLEMDDIILEYMKISEAFSAFSENHEFSEGFRSHARGINEKYIQFSGDMLELTSEINDDVSEINVILKRTTDQLVRDESADLPDKLILQIRDGYYLESRRTMLRVMAWFEQLRQILRGESDVSTESDFISRKTFKSAEPIPSHGDMTSENDSIRSVGSLGAEDEAEHDIVAAEGGMGGNDGVGDVPGKGGVQRSNGNTSVHPNAIPDAAPVDDIVERIWGELPSRMQPARPSGSVSESFHPRYRRETGAFFQRLLEPTPEPIS
jgi:hypothetical protein